MVAKKGRRMKEERLMQELSLRLEKEGYQSRTVSVRCVRDLQESIERNQAQGLLNEEFYQERLTHFSFKLPDILTDAQSLTVVAAPQPQIRVVFTWKGEPRPVLIPPTYVHGTDKIVESILSDVLDPGRHHFARAALPLKLLAVRSGLGDYGRNNICYLPGVGRFHRVLAYYPNI